MHSPPTLFGFSQMCSFFQHAALHSCCTMNDFMGWKNE